MNVRIRLQGCDDDTVVDLILDEDSVSLLETVAERLNIESTCDCMPTMHITILKE